ncbi:MAG: SDR family oxidoreductase [Aquihabitans sp.]
MAPWSTALVTGASSGIGEAIARQLSEAGTDVVAVARRRDRLDALAEAVTAGRGRIQSLVADLSTAAGIETVATRLADQDRPIDLLVNCAGVGASGPLADGSIDEYRRLINLNVTALVALTHAAVGPMSDRGRGWIMNISSLGGHAPGPNFAVYSATKAFVTSFSESIHEELRSTGVVVTVVCPGATHTDFGAASGALDDNLPSFLWQQPEEVAREAIAATAAGKALRVTGVPNRISAAITTVLPRSANRWIAAKVTERL